MVDEIFTKNAISMLLASVELQVELQSHKVELQRLVMNFLPNCKILVSEINLKSQERGHLKMCPFSVSLLLVFNQPSNSSNNFLRHPVV